MTFRSPWRNYTHAQNGGLQIFNWLTAILGASLVDRVGRRPLWLFTFSGMLAVNIPFGVCSAYVSDGNGVHTEDSTLIRADCTPPRVT